VACPSLRFAFQTEPLGYPIPLETRPQRGSAQPTGFFPECPPVVYATTLQSTPPTTSVGSPPRHPSGAATAPKLHLLLGLRKHLVHSVKRRLLSLGTFLHRYIARFPIPSRGCGISIPLALSPRRIVFPPPIPTRCPSKAAFTSTIPTTSRG